MNEFDFERYHLALNQILSNSLGKSTDDLAESQVEKAAISDSLTHRARSIRHHLNLLEVMHRNSKDQKALNHPRTSLDFLTQIHSIQLPAEIFFEDMIFNFGSYYDYLAKLILLFFSNHQSRKDWRQLISELNRRENKQGSLFDQTEIQKVTVTKIIKINRERIHPLYDYRSDLIHNRTDKTSGRKTSVYTQGASPSVESSITIGIPKNFSNIMEKLVGFEIDPPSGSLNIFQASKSLYIYFWNTNIQIMNVMIVENNSRYKIEIQELSPIVDGV